MKNRYFPLFAAISLTFLFAADIFPQKNSSDEFRPRVVNSGSSKRQETLFDLEKKVFALINNIRRINNLSELVWDERVAAIARTHSTDMAEKSFFSHRGFNGSMIDDRADSGGLGRWRAIGENIAYNRGYAKPPEFAVECWMKSQGHRENLLDARWKETGIGIAQSGDGAYYFTQVFLQRK
jgi:uncharacterized protein YkwD